MIRPTRLFLNLLLLAFVPAILPAILGEDLWPLWATMVGILLILLLLDFALMARAGDFEVSLYAPSQIYIGDAAEAEIHLDYQGWSKRQAITAVLDLDSRFDALAPWTGEMLADRHVEMNWPLVPRRRGNPQVETFSFAWRGPLGLASASQRMTLDHEVVVTTNLSKVKDSAIRFMSNPEFLAGLKAERFLGEGSEFDRMREFQQGMDQRHIDWKASARHRRLLSRQYRLERNHQIVISFDTGHLMSEPIDGMPRLDHAVSAGMLLAWCSLKAQDRVVIHAFDDKVRHFSDSHSGVKSLGQVQSATSQFDYGTGEANYTLAMTDLSVRLKRRSLVVVLTEFADSITAEIMVENLMRLSRRHLVLFVALRDSELVRIGESPPRDLTSVGLSVVANSLLDDRARVIRKLTRAGILCLDVKPEDLSSSLISSYLDIKVKERI
ncbi:MAG: hypothetical protein ACI97A_004239 [Planctomycetota bacterium]|jgi:uncharacterized protein (DUF58 family)